MYDDNLEMRRIPTEADIAKEQAHADELQAELDGLEKGHDSTHPIAMRSLLEEVPGVELATNLSPAMAKMGPLSEELRAIGKLGVDALNIQLGLVKERETPTSHSPENKFWRLRIALNHQLAKVASMKSEKQFYDMRRR